MDLYPLPKRCNLSLEITNIKNSQKSILDCGKAETYKKRTKTGYLLA